MSKDVLQFMLRSWCPNCDYASLNIQSMQEHLGQCTNNETFEKPNIKVEPVEDEEFVETIEVNYVRNYVRTVGLITTEG